MYTDPFLSIIVPIYNAEKYLQKCIKSILSQNISNIELLLINDGSTDTSKQICDEFKYIDSRIVFINQENYGVSTARNTGIKKAKGKYILFIDADDWIDSYSLSPLIEFIKIQNIDFLQFSYKKIFKNDIISDISIKHPYNAVFNRDEYLIKNFFDGYVCGKVISMRLINNNNIMFNPKIKITEDLEFMIKCILNARSVGYFINPFYNYLFHTASATHTINFQKALNYLDVGIEISNYAKKDRLKSEISIGFVKKEAINNLNLFLNAISFCKIESAEKYQIKLILKNYYEAIDISNKEFSISIKIKNIMLKYFPCIFIWAYQEYYKLRISFNLFKNTNNAI